MGEGVEKEGEVSEEKRKRSASFFPTARDRSGQSSEIGGAPEPPRFLVLFFSAALVVHKSVSEALVQTRGSKKKQSKRGRNGCGAEEIQPPPPPVIEKGRRRLQVIVRAPLFVRFGAPFRDSSALHKRAPLGWRKLAKRVPESRGGKKGAFPLFGRRRRSREEKKKPSASSALEGAFRPPRLFSWISRRAIEVAEQRQGRGRTQRDISRTCHKKKQKKAFALRNRIRGEKK